RTADCSMRSRVASSGPGSPSCLDGTERRWSSASRAGEVGISEPCWATAVAEVVDYRCRPHRPSECGGRAKAVWKPPVKVPDRETLKCLLDHGQVWRQHVRFGGGRGKPPP